MIDTTLLIVIIVVAILAAAGLTFLLYFTLIKRSVLKKQAKDIIGDFETEHAVLFGDIQRYVTRLKAISDLNILYIDPYTTWHMKFKDVRDGSDANAQSVANSLKDALDGKHWGELKNFLPTAKAEIEDYVSRVEALKEGLIEVFSLEEEITSLSLQEKEKYRSIKQKYNSEADDLSLVAESMGALFKRIDAKIEFADEQKDKASYQEAKDIYLNEVDKILGQIDLLLNTLPNTCLEVTSVLPDKISSLRNRYQDLLKEGYPLNHIVSKKEIDKMDADINALTQSIKVLNNNGVSRAIDTIRTNIDGYNEAFDKEVEARAIFLANNEKIYREENEIHQKFVNLSNSIEEIKSYYLLGADDIQTMKNIGLAINDAEAAKTLLDNYVHSNSPQLYTILIEKMDELKKLADKAKTQLEDFERYLHSLKSSFGEAASAVRVYFERTKNGESEVRSLRVEALNKHFAPKFRSIYETIDLLYADLNTMPVNIKKVQEELGRLKEEGDAVAKEITETKEDIAKAEQAIVHANRYRAGNAAVEQIVSQGEAMFANTSYKESYRIVQDVNHSR